MRFRAQAFNASYRVWWMCLMFSGSMASATGIQLGGALGKGDTTAVRASVHSLRTHDFCSALHSLLERKQTKQKNKKIIDPQN